ncbi:hypothetical protein PCYB_012610, partial [Plasmodium cynomolgi strain B]
LCSNGYDTFFGEPSRNYDRKLSEKLLNDEGNTTVGSTLEEASTLEGVADAGEEGTTEHGSSADRTGSIGGGSSSDHGRRTDHRRSSSTRSKLESYFSSEGPSNSRHPERFSLEDRLKKEWNDLAIIETKNWFNVIIGICDTLITEYDSYNVVDDKVRSWTNLIKMLTTFREAEINESNIIFSKFLDYVREKRHDKPSDCLTEEEESIWNDIKLLKQQKDIEWKKYHVGTWKYWFQMEFPTANLRKNE